MKIDRLSEQQAKVLLPQLTALLQDAVDSGASIGFLPPLAPEMAEDYWAGVLREMGYTRAGIIPQYARSADGMLHETVLFYRLL